MRLGDWSLQFYRLPYGREVVWANAVESSGLYALLTLRSTDGATGIAEGTLKDTWSGVSPKSLAAVNGHAHGGGLEMALCCDFIFAAQGARLSLPEVSRGLMPGGMGTQNLARAIGERRAKELVLSARALTAEEALAWGLANRVCAPAKLVEEALAMAESIAGNGPLAVRQAKKSIHYGLGMDLLTGYRFEIEAYNRLVDTDDRREGVNAFVEKRKPRFTGK